jgi:hypothetical protein
MNALAVEIRTRWKAIRSVALIDSPSSQNEGQRIHTAVCTAAHGSPELMEAIQFALEQMRI